MKIFISIPNDSGKFGELTKHTSPALLRVGKKPILSYIIESYPKHKEFFIRPDDFSEHIKDFLVLAYPDKKFIFTEKTRSPVHNHPGLKIPLMSGWFEIKNIRDLSYARKHISDTFDNLDKVDESLFFFKDFAIKFFADKKKVKDRVERGKLLGKLVPRMIRVKNNFYKYEFVKGRTYSDVATPSDFKRFLNWSLKNLWKKSNSVSDAKFESICKDFYEVKTKERVNKFLKSHDLKDVPSIINGQKVPSMNDLLAIVDFKSLSKGIQTGFHGDFILENILKTKKGYILLDWRQDFGGLLKSGDMYYDLAKLYHNLVVNHDIISKNQFIIKIKGNKITCNIKRKSNLVACEKAFDKFIISKKLDLNRIRIFRAIIWINMSSLHHHPFSLFLYYFGKYNLWKALKAQKQ